MSWDLKPSVIVGCCALISVYAWAVAYRRSVPLPAARGSAWSSEPRPSGSGYASFTVRALLWLLGVLLIFVALCSPLDELADTYLFSVHMAKHILFVLVVPALLLMGLPAHPFRRLLGHTSTRRAESFLRYPPVAWAAGIGVMLFWHIPAVFNAALANEPLHIIEHLSLLVGGTIYWWPVLSPMPESRMRPVPQAAAYLFTSCLACTAIGIVITFAPSLLYTAYAHPNDVSGILPVIRERWGISAAMDQQIGGLLMWVPGCLVYLTAIMAMFARWYGEEPQTALEV